MKALNAPDDQPECFFLDGPDGSGKTYLYDVLIDRVKGMNQIVLPAATTGNAANLLEVGHTVQSLFGIPVPVHDTSVSQIRMGSHAAELLKSVKLLIIDECTMASKHMTIVIDKLPKEVMTENI